MTLYEESTTNRLYWELPAKEFFIPKTSNLLTRVSAIVTSYQQWDFPSQKHFTYEQGSERHFQRYHLPIDDREKWQSLQDGNSILLFPMTSTSKNYPAPLLYLCQSTQTYIMRWRMFCHPIFRTANNREKLHSHGCNSVTSCWRHFSPSANQTFPNNRN